MAVLEKEVPFIEMGTLDQQTEVKIVFMLAMNKADDKDNCTTVDTNFSK